MATHYVDPAAAGTNAGTSWTDAWTDFASALAAPVAAGDTVYCRGSQTTVAVKASAVSGTVGAYIAYIGCNASGNVDGTRFTLNANGGVFDVYDPASYDYLIFENIRFTGAGTGDGMDTSGTASDGLVFINCSFDSNGGNGVYGAGIAATYIRCVFYGNTADGWTSGTTAGSRFWYCCSHDNGVHGFDAEGYGVTLINCLIYDNGDDGVNNTGAASVILGCTIDSNVDDGITAGGSHSYVIGNRITNHSGVGDIGLNIAATRTVFHGWNYFENNDGANIQGAGASYPILYNGAATNVEDQANTNQGYTSLTEGSEDYNLRSDASLRRTAMTIPTS